MPVGLCSCNESSFCQTALVLSKSSGVYNLHVDIQCISIALPLGWLCIWTCHMACWPLCCSTWPGKIWLVLIITLEDEISDFTYVILGGEGMVTLRIRSTWIFIKWTGNTACEMVNHFSVYTRLIVWKPDQCLAILVPLLWTGFP